HDEIDAEDFCPEARRMIIGFVSSTERHALQHHNQRRQTHGQLWKQIVECNGEGKVETVDDKSMVQNCTSFKLQRMRVPISLRDSLPFPQPVFDAVLSVSLGGIHRCVSYGQRLFSRGWRSGKSNPPKTARNPAVLFLRQFQ